MAARAVTTIHAFLQGTMESLTGNFGKLIRWRKA